MKKDIKNQKSKNTRLLKENTKINEDNRHIKTKNINNIEKETKLELQLKRRNITNERLKEENVVQKTTFSNELSKLVEKQKTNVKEIKSRYKKNIVGVIEETNNLLDKITQFELSYIDGINEKSIELRDIAFKNHKENVSQTTNDIINYIKNLPLEAKITKLQDNMSISSKPISLVKEKQALVKEKKINSSESLFQGIM